MKNIFKFVVLTIFLQNIASCAFLFNKKEVDVVIDSMPAGADIFIEGRHYGKTPRTIRIEPKNYMATITKEGYGTTQLQLDSWQAVRADKGDGSRCVADALGSMLILPVFSYWSVYCRDFKQPKYSAVIPYNGPDRNVHSGGSAAYSRGSAYNNGTYGNYNQGSYYQPQIDKTQYAPQQNYQPQAVYQQAPRETRINVKQTSQRRYHFNKGE